MNKRNNLAVVELDGPDSDFDDEIQDPTSVTTEQLLQKAHDIFGTDNAALIGDIVHAALQIKASKDRITAEIIILGGRLYEVFTLTQTSQTTLFGNSRGVRNKAAKLAYDFINSAFSLKRGSIRLYISCHRKFMDNAEAIDLLGISELSLLTKSSVTAEDVSEVIQAKKADPSMSREEIKQLLKTQAQLKEDLLAKEEGLEAMESEVATSMGKATDLERENRRLQEQIATLKQEQSTRRDELSNLHSEVVRRSTAQSSMQKTVSDLTLEVNRLTVQVAEHESAEPKQVVVEVPTIVDQIPIPYITAEKAARAKLDELAAAKEEVHTSKLEIQKLEDRKAALRAEIDAAAKAQRHLDQLLEDWSKFSANFTLAQLAVQADGHPTRYQPTLRALTDTLRKFLTELEAAANFKPA